MSKDLDYWKNKAEKLVIEQLKLHSGGFDPKMAKFESAVTDLLTFACLASYEEGLKDADVKATEGSVKLSPVTLSLSMAGAQVLFAVMNEVGRILHENEWPELEVLRDVHNLWLETFDE